MIGITVGLAGAIGLSCTVIGALIGYFTFNRNRDKDIKSDATESATERAEVSVKLNHIIKGVDDVKLDLKTNEQQINQINTQLVRVDESAKSAHKRIDEIDKGR